jgi:membrane-bound inhibitor of C-type lysozyme/uncharacterized membrane protein
VTLRLCMLALLSCLAACSSGGVRDSDESWDPDSRPLGKTLVYECSGYDFIARLGPGEMAVWLEDRYLILSRVRSASGTKYEEGDTLFWSKGDEAVFVVDQQRFEDCQLAPARVPWEDARRRGVDFRAVGNEPGWYLEIQRGRQLLFVGDYGMQRVMLPDPGATSSGELRTFHAVSDSNDLRIEIRGQSCSDDMSGERFPSQVILELNGATLRGCGRDLEHPWE